MRISSKLVPLVFLGLGFSFAGAARAASTPTLSNLNPTQAQTVMKNFANAIVFRSLEPPSANGTIFGFGVGVVGSATSAKHVNDALGQNIPAIPAGDIVLVGQGPMGLALEMGFLPSLKLKDFSFKRIGFNARWTFTEVFLRDRVPFDAALRFGYGSNQFAYDQVVSGVQDRVEFKSKALRAELAMSRKLLFLEPYIGLGYLRTSSALSNAAGVSTPLYNFTTASSLDYSKGSFLFDVGAEIRLVLLTLGAEVDWAFGETTGAVKVGLKF